MPISVNSIPTFSTILVLSAALRVGLIIYSEWHDARPGTVVKYTDIDYRVFSDATAFLLRPSAANNNMAKGPLAPPWIGDPYTRETYRYTPLLALLLAPTEWQHPSFGKYVFAACDLINGALIRHMLLGGIIPRNGPAASKDGPSEGKDSGARRAASLATLYAALHLLNPLIFTISTRGSSESVLATLVLATLACALRGRWDAAAVGLGLATHWKVYPVVYGVACVSAIAGEGGWGWRAWVNVRTARFALVSAGTFGLLGLGCYLIWGYPFLHEAYLYHVNRRDHRHNFSPYFYLIYLTYPRLDPSPSEQVPEFSWWIRLASSPLTSFLPQMTLTLGTGLVFGRHRQDLVFAWFVQTAVFVTFNKVCTSQYFLWYLIFLPLLLPRLHVPPRWAVAYLAVWVGTQAIWLEAAYRLEFLGESVFLGLWARSLLWVAGNAWVIGGLMEGYMSE